MFNNLSATKGNGYHSAADLTNTSPVGYVTCGAGYFDEDQYLMLQRHDDFITFLCETYGRYLKDTLGNYSEVTNNRAITDFKMRIMEHSNLCFTASLEFGGKISYASEPQFWFNNARRKACSVGMFFKKRMGIDVSNGFIDYFTEAIEDLQDLSTPTPTTDDDSFESLLTDIGNNSGCEDICGFITRLVDLVTKADSNTTPPTPPTPPTASPL